MIRIISSISILLCSLNFAAVISPHGQEIQFSFVADFVADLADFRGWRSDEATAAQAAIDRHYQHMFGLFHSDKLLENFGFDSYYVEGLGAIRLPAKTKILEMRFPTKSESPAHIAHNSKKALLNKDNYKANALLSPSTRYIRYQFKSKGLFHKKVAKRWLKRKKLSLPLPYDLNDFYDYNCTDKHYPGIADFWYFYNPFRFTEDFDCRYLKTLPKSKAVTIKVSQTIAKVKELSPKLNYLTADNANGKQLLIYIFVGADGNVSSPKDEGREVFNTLNKNFEDKNFKLTKTWNFADRPRHDYAKTIRHKSKTVNVEVRNFLLETATRNRLTFAKQFVKAVEEADVIIYAGHSGLGEYLDLDYIAEQAGKDIVFPKNKRQIFYLDACASYSYYLDHYFFNKTKAKIDVITNALSSIYVESTPMMIHLIDTILDLKSPIKTWENILLEMEMQLPEGSTYLLNVGAV